MTANTYSDGFPLTPLEAIEFSYFLSEGEKQEWREWLQTATIEQQNELVDILHSMWLDNQKQTVPTAFNPNNNQQTQQQPGLSQAPPSNAFNVFPQTDNANFNQGFNNNFQNFNPGINPTPPAQDGLNHFDFNNPQVFPSSQQSQQFNPNQGFNQSSTPTLNQIPNQTSIYPNQGLNNQLPNFNFNPNSPELQNYSTSQTIQNPESHINNSQSGFAQPTIPTITTPTNDFNFDNSGTSSFSNQQQNDSSNFEDHFSNFSFATDDVPDQPQFDDSFQAPNLSVPQISATGSNRTGNTFGGPSNKTTTSANLIDLDDYEDEDDDGYSKDQHPLSQPIMDHVGDDQEEALRKMANTKYSPNPLLDDDTPALEEFVYKNADAEKPDSTSNKNKNNQSKNTQNKGRNDRDNQNDKPEKQKPNENVKEEKKKAFLNASQIKQSGTKDALEELYKTYQGSREKRSSSLNEFEEKQSIFFDKMMQIMLNFEDVGNYYEALIEKIIEVNDKVVEQAKDIQILKNSSQSRGGVSLQDQIDELNDEIDRVNRDLRVVRGDQRKKYDEVSGQLAAFGADVYRQDGVMQKLDLMKADIIQLQQKLNINTDFKPKQGNNQPKQNQQKRSNQDFRNKNNNQSQSQNEPSDFSELSDIEEF